MTELKPNFTEELRGLRQSPLVDSEQRSLATDPALSFIVQAPAGSGKTEILTQRYLRLLSTVTSPEQIIALTFTRKAASEMRERILIALQQASSNHIATSLHQQKTLNFAREALNRSKQFQWDLLQQSNRLRVITIDSLCQSINQAIPLVEQQIAYPQITDKPENCYLNAARRCIQFAMETPQYQHAIKTLLLHVDNKQDRLLKLFKALLAQRDQWLYSLFQARAQEKSTFEQALHFIEQHELTRFKQTLPPLLASELMRLSRELVLIENNPTLSRYLLRDWYDFHQCTPEIVAALSTILLTGDNFRKSFDHHVGLKKGSCTDREYNTLKQASKELLSQLSDYPDFLNSLIQVSQLPKPEYDLEQWEVLQALFILLPLLVGHLHVFFSERNEVDFIAIAQQALTALGDSENPTDLALYLDNAIYHLLVDEFQDTSISQFELLTKMVQGWQNNDGRTLFIVGDPMQSIYRFRQAEVGLFFRAKEQGIGPVQLRSLELSCNFRSTDTIVNWVNHHFARIFPQQVDIESGAVSFHPSVSIIKNQRSSAVHALQFKSREQEAQYLIQTVQYELNTNPHQTIAILVRSRSQLGSIIRLLRQNQIPYQGTDIDLLANLEHLRDIYSLTNALLFPGNRLSWLAMLRSPYCGLNLKDTLCIAQFNKNESIYDALLQLENIQGLSGEGRIRSQFFIRVMQKALLQRSQLILSDWVIQTLKELHIDKILNQSQLVDLEQFWTLLDSYEQDSRLPDMNEFMKEFNQLYSQQTNLSRLQIMTIHKSKGLEFDTVFLPGLGTQPNSGDNPMLRWLKIPTQNKGDLLLVSPIHGDHQDDCALYNYLGQLDEEKSDYEAQRLLYVAATRAKSRLYLMDGSTKTNKRSFRSLLKTQEFIALEQQEENEEVTTQLLPLLTKLPLEFYQHPPVNNTLSINRIRPQLTTSIPRLTGIVAHRILHWICGNHPQSIDQVPWNLAHDEFKQLGFNQEIQEQAFSVLQDQITRLFLDETGLWILGQHDNERNEYELLVELEGSMATRIIDRTFEDQGALWIIDFKTGKEDHFASTQHQQQVNEYGFYLANRTNLPIHCGLYYLVNNHWLTWEYQ